MNKRLWILVGGLGILVAVGALSAIFAPHTISISTRSYAPANFSTAVNYSDSSILFSNGRSFVSYDLDSNQSQTLSPEDSQNGLIGIDSVSSSSSADDIVFHSESMQPGGVLARTLQNTGDTRTNDVWWLYSSKTQAFSPLPSGVLLAKADDAGIYALQTGANGESITTYSPHSLHTVSTTQIPGSSNFWAYNNGFLLQLGDGDLAYTEDGVVSQTLFAKTALLGLSHTKNIAFATSKTGSTSFYRLDLEKHSKSLVAKNLQTQPLLSASDTAIYTKTSGTDLHTAVQYVIYNLTHKRTSTLSPSGIAEALSTSSTPQPLLLVGDHQFTAKDASGNLILYGTDHAISDPSSYNKTVGSAANSIQIRYDQNRSAFVVSYPAGTASTVLAQVESQLRSDGFDPSLFTILPEQFAGE